MGSIPLPALDIRPPAAQPDPIEQYARLQQLRNQQQIQPLQQQAMQQQVQAGQLENQQRQQQMQDSQTLRQLSPEFVKKDDSGKVTGYDYQGFFNKAAQAGVSPNTLLPLQKSISEATLAQLNVSKEQRANQQAINDQAYQHLEGLKGVSDPAQRQQLWTAATQWAQQNAPSAAQALPQQVPDDKGLSVIEAQLGMHAQQLADATKTADIAEKQSTTTLNAAKGDEARVNTVLAPQRLASEQANQAATRQQEQQRIGIEGARLGLERQKASIDQLQSGATGADFLATLPSGVQAQVKAAANGDIAIPPPSARSPQAQAIRSAVLQYDPTYTDARYKGKQEFKTGPDAVAIQGAATMLGHLQDAKQNSDAVGTAPALGTRFQTPTDAKYMKDVQLYTNEVGKLTSGKAITEDEGKQLLSGLTSFRSDVRMAALDELAKLSQSRIQAGFQKYKTATGQDLPVDEFFDAPTQKNLEKIGVTQPKSKADPFTQFGGFAH